MNDNVNISNISKRIISFSIDEILLSILFIIIYKEAIFSAQTQEEMLMVLSSFAWQYVIIKILYQTFFIWYYGATLGKLVCKIKCIGPDMQKPDFQTSFLRAAVRILSESFFYIGYIWAFFNPLKQTWHDKIAKTLVVNFD